MTNIIILYLVSAGLSLLSSLFICLAINSDAKARNLKARKTYAILAFFFPLIVGIVYACTRNNAKTLDTPLTTDPKKLVKKSIIYIIVAILIYVGSFGFGVYMGVSGLTGDNGIFSMFEDREMYDMKGNLIANDMAMPAYDRDGNKYLLYESSIDDEEYFSYYANEATNEEFDSEFCYVDSEGYFFFDKDGKVDVNDDGDFADEAGNIYYTIDEIYWDADGQMQNLWDDLF